MPYTIYTHIDALAPIPGKTDIDVLAALKFAAGAKAATIASLGLTGATDDGIAFQAVASQAAPESGGILWMKAGDSTLRFLTPLGEIVLGEGGGGIGSIALSLPSIFSVSGSPLTEDGTITATLATQAMNKVWAGPSSGSDAEPTFRVLVAADIPNLDAAKITSGTIDMARLPAIATAVQVISTGGIAALDSGQQATIIAGAVVTTTDGRRWIYKGVGSKTSEASYIESGDVTPDWSVVANRPAILLSMAALAGTADTLPYFSAANTLAHTAVTSLARTMLARSTAALWRNDLGVDIWVAQASVYRDRPDVATPPKVYLYFDEASAYSEGDTFLFQLFQTGIGLLNEVTIELDADSSVSGANVPVDISDMPDLATLESRVIAALDANSSGFWTAGADEAGEYIVAHSDYSGANYYIVQTGTGNLSGATQAAVYGTFVAGAAGTSYAVLKAQVGLGYHQIIHAIVVEASGNAWNNDICIGYGSNHSEVEDTQNALVCGALNASQWKSIGNGLVSPSNPSLAINLISPPHSTALAVTRSQISPELGETYHAATVTVFGFTRKA